MQHAQFNDILDQQIKLCRDVLVVKSESYASDSDKLHNFKVAADIQGCSLSQAVAGMMVKHTVSVFDMCASDKDFDLAVWDEKITDHLNYLFLLKAAVVEEAYDTMPWAMLPAFETTSKHTDESIYSNI